MSDDPKASLHCTVNADNEIKRGFVQCRQATGRACNARERKLVPETAVADGERRGDAPSKRGTLMLRGDWS